MKKFKFKKNDRVQIINNKLLKYGIHEGDTGIVMENDDVPYVEWNRKKEIWAISQDYLELIKNSKLTNIETANDKPIMSIGDNLSKFPKCTICNNTPVLNTDGSTFVELVCMCEGQPCPVDLLGIWRKHINDILLNKESKNVK